MLKRIKPEDIYKKDVSFKIDVNGENCRVRIEEALFAKYNGQEILLDDVVIKKMITDLGDVIKHSTSKYNQFPKTITISHHDSGIHSDIISNDNKDDDVSFIDSYHPRWSFEDIYIEENIKKQIIYSLALIENRDILFKDWGLGETVKAERAVILNFYGPPGTGKTITAEAIADYLNRDVFLVNYAELESKYVGETPKNIKKVFQKAKISNGVLIFDEADSFLGKRLTNISQSADYGVNITRSVLLKEIEKFDGIIVFTTNLMGNYDKAFKRRILANIKFSKPDSTGREKIWDKLLPDRLPLQKDISIKQLAERYDNITGADIRDIILYASLICLDDQRYLLTKEDFQISYQYIINRYSAMENTPKILNHEKISENEFQTERENFN